MNQIILLALIAALKQEVVLLQQELAEQTAVVQQYVPPIQTPIIQEPIVSPPVITTPIQIIEPVLGVVSSTPDIATGEYECVDQQGFSSTTNHPTCAYVSGDPYPPIIMKTQYQHSDGTTYWQ